jgi:hypothetical protein
LIYTPHLCLSEIVRVAALSVCSHVSFCYETTECDHLLLSFQGARGIPIIIPQCLQPALAFLTNLEVRRECNVAIANSFVFAQPGGTAISIYSAIVSVCQSADLEAPDRLTSTNVRKYMATVVQVGFFSSYGNICAIILVLHGQL